MANSRRADSVDPVAADARGYALFRFWLRSWQAEKTPGLNGDVAKVGKPATFPDHVEKIAMIPRRAASVHFPAAPLPDSPPFSRTNIERPGVFLTSPTSQ